MEIDLKFPKIYRLGHKEVRNILEGPVEVTEKIDGSQISFGIIEKKLVVRSKNTEINPADVPNQFMNSYQSIQRIFSEGKMEEGYFYYGEAVRGLRHNVITYARIPKGHTALYSIRKPDGTFEPDFKVIENTANSFGIDTVPFKHIGTISVQELEDILKQDSFYGPRMEGLVIKSFRKKFEMAKLVRDDYKEVSRHVIKNSLPLEQRITELFLRYKTNARWDKAIQHYLDAGNSPDDKLVIPSLIKEVTQDILEEEGETIKNSLFAMFRKQFIRTVTDGLAEYYFNRENRDED